MGDEDGERSSAGADEQTVAHQVFAPASAAESTFGGPPVPPPLDQGSPDAVRDEGEPDAEDDEEPAERRVSFATKALIVAAAWVLLVLFLTGRFTDEDDPGPGPVGLDQTAEVDGAGLEAGDAALGESVDVDGDGLIEPGEPGYGSAGSADGGVAGPGDDTGSAVVTGGGGSGTRGSEGDQPGDDSDPVVVPGTRAPTTTVEPGLATTTTADPGGSPDPTTPAPTSTTEPFDGEVVRISEACTFDRDAVAVPGGAVAVRFVNESATPKVIRYLGTNHTVAANGHLDRTFSHDRTVACRADGDTVDEIAIDLDA